MSKLRKRQCQLVSFGLWTALSLIGARPSTACSELPDGLQHSLAGNNTSGSDEFDKGLDGVPANFPLTFRTWSYDRPWPELHGDLSVRVWSDLHNVELSGQLRWGPAEIGESSWEQSGLVAWIPDEPFTPHDVLRVEASVVHGTSAGVEKTEVFARVGEPSVALPEPPQVTAGRLAEFVTADNGQTICCETQVLHSCGGMAFCTAYRNQLMPELQFSTAAIGPAVVQIYRLDENMAAAPYMSRVVHRGAPQIAGEIQFEQRQAQYCVQIEIVDLTNGDSRRGAPWCVAHGDLNLPRVDTLGDPVALLAENAPACVGPIYDLETSEVLVPLPSGDRGCSSAGDRPHGAWGLAPVGGMLLVVECRRRARRRRRVIRATTCDRGSVSKPVDQPRR
ncbi:MAG: hypothetical protein B7733_17380 [Myxococcales bacterium FL481]|nr:MAG: hypothetical protein B7733_17380 [Myxococcales bacterium FL481]